MYTRWSMQNRFASDMKAITLACLIFILSGGTIKAFAQQNLDFEQGLKGWEMVGYEADFNLEKGSGHHSNFSVRIGTGHGVLQKRIDVGPLSIIQFSAYVKSSQKGVKGYSFISFFDIHNKLLLTYKSDALDSISWQQTGNYTETPANTAYAEIGIEKDTSGKGYIYADDFRIETNIGMPKAKHQPLCNLDEYMAPFWKSGTVYNETVLMYSVNGKPATGKLLYSPSKIIAVRKFDLSASYKAGVDYALSGNIIARPYLNHQIRIILGSFAYGEISLKKYNQSQHSQQAYWQHYPTALYDQVTEVYLLPGRQLPGGSRGVN